MRSDDSAADAQDDRPRIILNPSSGDATHADQVRRLAAERDYAVDETQRGGDARALAKTAATNGIESIIACGGDGTVHGVVQGLVEAEALADVMLGVLPAGTANRFARDIGIEDLESGFEVLTTGETRQLDLGIAGESEELEPFVMSCITGLTAEASAAASSELKARVGTLAFVLTGLRESNDFEPFGVNITGVGESENDDINWRGEALCILVGNSRRFGKEGGQANLEDGRLNVTIVEEMPAGNIVTEAATHRLLGRETDHVTRLTVERLRIESTNDSREFSLDGEFSTHRYLDIRVRPQALSVRVGSTYNPTGA